MSLQTSIDFNVHLKERQSEGTETMQRHELRLKKACKVLLKYWQTNNIPLSVADARLHFGINNLTQRVYDMREHNGIVILTQWDSTKTFKLYQLGCQCPTPKQDTTGCYLHSDKLRIV